MKQLGIEMRKSRRTLFEQEKEESDDIVFNGSGSAANSPVVGILHIKQEKDEHNCVKTRSSSNLRSPPPQLFHGMKRYSEETFSEMMSQSKKRKTGNTPSHQKTPVSTPNRVPAPADECLAQVEIKCKKCRPRKQFPAYEEG